MKWRASSDTTFIDVDEIESIDVDVHLRSGPRSCKAKLCRQPGSAQSYYLDP